MNEQVARLYAEVGVKITGALRQLREFRTRLGQGQSGLKTLRDQSKITSTAINTGITAALAVFGNKAVSSFGDAEKAMNVFRVATGATTEEMGKASAAIEAIAHDLSLPGITRADAANALAELGKAGLSATDAINALRPALLLAEAGGIKGAEAAEILAAALQSFHLPGTEAARVADLLAAAELRASGTVRDHAEALKQAGAVFAMAGVPIEDLVTSIAQLANAGIKGSDAGTSLRTMLLRLLSPTEEAKGLMTAMGVSIYDAQGRMRDWRDIIDQFHRGLAPLTEAQRNQRLETIFGADAIRAASIIFGEGAAGADKMKASLTQAGAAQELATAKTQGLSGATDGLAKAIDTASADAVKPFAEDIKTLATALTEAVLWFDGLDDGTKKLVVGAAALAAALVPVSLIVGAVVQLVAYAITAVSTLWGWFGSLGAAAEALAGPLGAFVGPAGLFLAFAAGVIWAYENVDKLNDAFHRLTGVRVDFSAVFQSVPLLREIVSIWQELKNLGLVGGGSGGSHVAVPAGGSGAGGVGGSWGPPVNVGGGATGYVGGKEIVAHAMGGPVSAGHPYLVGERGPELFVPGRSGGIVPNGAGGAVINNNFYGPLYGFSDLKDMVVRAISEAKAEGRV